MSISRFAMLNYMFCKEFDLSPPAFLLGSCGARIP